MMIHFRSYHVVCQCGHSNKPHPSPRIVVALILAGETYECRGCGTTLDLSKVELPETALVKRVRKELEGHIPARAA